MAGTGFRLKPIIWLTGQAGAGKTTLARALHQVIGGVILDGNEMRRSISENAGFCEQDRRTHNLRVARLAKVLSQYSIVIVAVIAPFEQVRKEIDKIANPIWIYVERDVPITKDKPFEPPQEYFVKVNSDNQTTQEQVSQIVHLLNLSKN